MNYRREIVQLRDAKGWTEKEIGQHLDLPPSTVHYWLSKEDESEKELPKRGRPRATSTSLDLSLVLDSLDNPFHTAVDIRDHLAPGISVDTVRNRLREHGMRCRTPARKPFLRQIHLEKRLEFARGHLYWSVRDWENVVFSDEKIFRASSRGPVRVYRPSESNRFDPRFILPTSNTPDRFTICVWMAFGKDFKILEPIHRKTLNKEYYTTVILPLVRDHLQRFGRVFMQDRSPIHTSYQATHWFEANNIEVMDDWPPKGPDMNPVENVWAELVRRIRNDATNRDQLWENVEAAFTVLSREYFNKLIASMPTRMQKVVDAEGGWTKY